MSCCGGNCGCGANCGCGSGCKGCNMYPDLEQGREAVETPELATAASEMEERKEVTVGAEMASEGGDSAHACKCNPCTCNSCAC